MRYFPPIQVQATTRTPLVIWNGETLNPLSYVLDGNQILVINSERFFAALPERNRQNFMEWIEPVLEKISRLDEDITRARERNQQDQVRQLNREKRETAASLNLEAFVRSRLRQPNHAQYLRQIKAVDYSVRWLVRPRDDGFRTFIKSNRQPYVPGSEIKGAMRSALILALLGDHRRNQQYRERLQEVNRTIHSGASPRDKLRTLEKQDGLLQNQLFRPRGNDAKFDLLRLLQVTDSNPLSVDNLRVRCLESMGTTRFTKTMIEALDQDVHFGFRLSLVDPQASAQVINELRLNDLVKEKWLEPERFFQAIYQRSAAILQKEIDYWSGNPAMQKQVRELQAENQPESPLLRLGGGQGFLSVTAGLSVLQQDATLYDQTIREGVSFQRRWRTVPGNFPKTRRVFSDGRGQAISLPGWVSLKIMS